MQESSLRGIVTAAGDGWRRLIPAHATVDVTEAVGFAMAVQPKSSREIGATSAIPGDQFD
jgi:hypothetical protein